jgi:hypothetical protein
VTYSFLVLSILFLLPGLVILLARRDLRRMLVVMGVLSLPFAATEFLFYPNYWEPQFLFDLVEIIGFGVEDVLFVVGLGWLTAGIYPAVTGRRILGPQRLADPRALLRLLGVFAAVAAAVVASVFAGIPTIYAAPVIMVAATLWIVLRRPDLAAPAALGALLTTAVYALLSWILMALIPGVFDLDWNTEEFTNIFVLGIPFEELMYGASAGLIGAVFYPYLTGARFLRPGTDGPRGRRRATGASP